MPTYYGSSIAETINGSVDADIIYGRGGNDVLNGLDGNDQFFWYETATGNDGLDTVNGGAGYDTLRLQWLNSFYDYTMSVSASGSTVVVTRGSGVIGNPVQTISYSQGVESLQLMLGPMGQMAHLVLNLGDLSGTSMTGTIMIDARGLEILTLNRGSSTNPLIVFGTPSADRFIGGPGNDQLYGYGGDDYLSGGAGDDTLVGGLGNDTYDLTDFRDSFVELPGEGIDTVQVGGRNYTLSAAVENLFIGVYGSSQGYVGIGNASNNEITGSQGGDYLIGLDGDDVLSGGTGASNTLQGGRGDDTYIMAAVGDTLVEFAGEGVDTVVSMLTTYTLRANFENLTFVSGDNTGSGNGLDNVMTGGTGRDRLSGLDGNDTLIGGGGDDVLLGGNGADRLIGGLGNDDLTGGAGADEFVYASPAEGVDVLRDFDHGQGDRIDLTDLMAQIGPLGDDPFANGVLAFQSVDGGINILYDADGSIGPGTAVHILTVLGTAIQQDSFIY